jgi:site-specific DNA recombinase
MAKKALLYIRVSTKEQAEKGYSVDGQLKELRPAVEAQGYEVVAVCTDKGYSRENLDRPGIDEMLDLVITGNIDAVWAWKRDRYGASPNPEILSMQLEDYGTELRALDDSGTGDDADFINGIKDAIAKRELRTTAARSRMGRLQKARAGKVVCSGVADYGFRFNETNDGYIVDEDTMPIVRRIFAMMANGGTLNGTVQTLNREGIKPPSARTWNQTFIKDKINDDVYKPHTYDEIREIVSNDVAALLDADKLYGVCWYNQHRLRNIISTVPDGNGGKKQKRRQKRTPLPRSEWIAVPVPDAGVPLEHVTAARAAIKDNVRPSNAGMRYWELSGGIVRCGDCGRAMRTQQIRKKRNDGIYHYYACKYPFQQPGSCHNKKLCRAEPLEGRVANLVSDILSNEDRLLSQIDALIEAERGKLGNVANETKAYADRIAEIDANYSRLLDLYADATISKAQLNAKIVSLDEQKSEAEAGLEKARKRSEKLAELERDRADLQRLYRERAVTAGLAAFDPKQRHQIYRRLKLVVYAHSDQSIGVEGDLPLSISYFDEPWYVTDVEHDSLGMTSTLVYTGKSVR